MEAKFPGETIAEQILPEHMDQIDALADKPEVVEAAPEEVDVSGEASDDASAEEAS